MKANELADHILNVKSWLEQATREEYPHILEGGMARLMMETSNEWEIYKIYCAWTERSLFTDTALKEFYKLQDKIKEAKNDKINYNRFQNFN
jgi:hypothetical protein